MSFKKCVNNEKWITSTEISMSEIMSEQDINQLRLCIHNDFSLLKPTIDFSQLTQFMPFDKKYFFFFLINILFKIDFHLIK
jgi:hypothetical protein